MLTMMICRWSWLLQLMCLVLYQRTGQIELLKILLDQFTKEELVEEDSARKYTQLSWIFEYYAVTFADFTTTGIRRLKKNATTMSFSLMWRTVGGLSVSILSVRSQNRSFQD